MSRPVQHALLAQLEASTPDPFFIPSQDWTYEAGLGFTLFSLMAVWGEWSVLLFPVLLCVWPFAWCRRRARVRAPAGWLLDLAQAELRPVRQPGRAVLPMSGGLGLLSHSGLIELCLAGQAPLGPLAAFHCNSAADREAVNLLTRRLCERYDLRLVGARS